MTNLQLGIIIYFVIINLITFIIFWYDKWMAQGKSWRVPESVLWILALLGGSIGALVSMFIFRHKTKKISFQFILVIIILIQVITIIFLFYPTLVFAKAYPVEEVIDGDTIKVNLEGKSENIRLIGIDTPEVESPYTSEECYGPEATQRTKDLVEGREVGLEVDLETDDRDKYGRLLRYVFIDDTFVNELLIKEGYAYAYTNETYKFHEDFINLEKEAYNNKVGIWGPEACNNYKNGMTRNFIEDILAIFYKIKLWLIS